MNNVDKAMEIFKQVHDTSSWKKTCDIEQELRTHLEAMEADRVRLLDALKAVLRRDETNTCQHEETHRGGAIWTICDGCGSKWADDRGGKPKWKDPKEWDQARAAIAQSEAQS